MEIDKEQIESQLISLLKEIFRESWMNDDDYNEFIEAALLQYGTSVQSLLNDIITGISNGYTVDVQFELIKQALKGLQ